MAKVKAAADPVSDESLLSALQMAVFSFYPHIEKNRGERKQVLMSLIRTLIPLKRTPLSLPNYLSRIPAPNWEQGESGFHHINFEGGHKHLV